MPTGYATRSARASFRAESPRLAAAQPFNQASGDFINFSSSPATVDLALDSIEATDLEREVVHLVCRVNSPRSALRVVAEYRAARRELNLGG